MRKSTLLILFAMGIVFTSCLKNDDTLVEDRRVSQSFQNLPDLGADFVYEGWVISGTSKVSTGRFTHSQAGNYVSNVIGGQILDLATSYVLTIEPLEESSADLATPSGWVFMKGSFVNNLAAPSTTDALFDGASDFDTATGRFFLKAPSVGATGSDANGIWFINALPPTGGGFTSLPALADGWTYEGWVVVPGTNSAQTPVSTGRFNDPDMADESFFGATNNNEFKGPNGVPPFPGEDFIADPNSRYPGVSFPIDLTSATVVISIEPTTNDEAAPFGLKPFSVTLNNQTVAMSVGMNNHYSGQAISGAVSK